MSLSQDTAPFAPAFSAAPALPAAPALARSTLSVALPAARSCPPALRKLALPALFLWFGVIMGSWVGRIPALRDGVQVSHSQLSFVLLCGGLGAVLSFPLSSRLMANFGGRLTMRIAGTALLGVLLAIGVAPSMPLLMAAVLMLGITASSFDVGMNAVAAAQEKASGRSSMSMLHACACAGGLAGVTLGSGMAALQIPPALHFALLALPLMAMLWLGTAVLAVGDEQQQIEKKAFVLPRGGLALLGALGFLGAVAECSIADWSGIYMKDHFGASDGFAPLALSAFSVMMLLSRLAGDRLKGRHGARVLVCGGALVAAAGLLCATLAPHQYAALAGFAVAGLGLSLVFPFVFSAAGREGTVALAGVATMTYSGSLMGPPMLGAIAHGLGLQAAMGFIALLSLAIAAVTMRTKLMR